MAKTKGLDSVNALPTSEPTRPPEESAPAGRTKQNKFITHTVEENASELERLLLKLSQKTKGEGEEDRISIAWTANLARSLASVLAEQTGEERYRELQDALISYEDNLSFTNPSPLDVSSLTSYTDHTIGADSTNPNKDNIHDKMRGISFSMDSMKDPGEAFINYGLPMGFYARYETEHMDRLAGQVAEITGGDPEQIKDKDTRTPEQQKALFNLLAAEQVKRYDAFRQSLFMRVLIELQSAKLEPTVEIVNEKGIPFDLLAQAVLYFFATNEGYAPDSSEPIDGFMIEGIRQIFFQMDRFYADNYTPGCDPSALLLSFIEQENPSRAMVSAIASQFPVIQSMTPRSHTIPNNPLMNALQQKDIIGIGPIDVVVANERGKKKEITSYTIAAFDTGDSDIKITDTKLTEYERQVSDAIVSLWEEARKQKLDPVFTADAIYRAMPGGSDKASPQQKGAITKSIEKFRRLHITVNATEEMRKRKLIGEEDTMNFDDFYLAATRAEYKIKNGGQTVTAYRINAEPIVLTYCKMTRQLLTVPAKYLSIRKVNKGALGESISMTSTRQAMTGYIIRRIKIMQRDADQAVLHKRAYDARRAKDPSLPDRPLSSFREQSDIISFDALFNDVGLSDQDRTETKRNRDFCMDVLEYQKAVGFIKDYEQQTKGRSISGVRIVN